MRPVASQQLSIQLASAVRSLLRTADHVNSRGTRAKGDALEAMASEADLARMAAMSAEIEELSERRVSAAAMNLPLDFCLSGVSS